MAIFYFTGAGGGGGGCAIILPRPGVKEDDEQTLEQALAMEGFEKYETVLGAAGVDVLFPALFRNGSQRDSWNATRTGRSPFGNT